VNDPDIKNRLFAYYHRKEKTFVIALWTDNGHHSFTDELNLGRFIGSMTREKFQNLLLRLNNPCRLVDQNKKLSAEAESNWMSKIQDEANMQSEHLKRKMFPGRIAVAV
jgi:hypothetical protein